jgi:uncharacterized repeat protein (TIGR03803 family)
MDAAEPLAGVTEVNGTLYGTTYRGGRFDNGAVFEISPSGAESLLYSFGDGGASDGAWPLGAMVDVDGTFYGTTSYSHGAVFKISTSGKESIVYRFGGGADGFAPYAGLINVGGTLYGTTIAGGGSGCYNGFGCGTVFKMSTSGAETVLHTFGVGSDGAGPEANLLNVNGTLYGTTVGGGANGSGCHTIDTSGCGTVFLITPSGGERILHSFTGDADGGNPYGNLIDVGGTLYGTTSRGGAGTRCGGGCGTVFSIAL